MAIESLLVIIASTVPTPCPDYQHPSHLHQLRVSDKIIFLSIFLEHANYFNMQCAILTYLSNLPVKKLSVFAMNINENNHDSGRKKMAPSFFSLLGVFRLQQNARCQKFTNKTFASPISAICLRANNTIHDKSSNNTELSNQSLR